MGDLRASWARNLEKYDEGFISLSPLARLVLYEKKGSLVGVNWAACEYETINGRKKS